MYVTEDNAGRVSKFTSDGNFITGWDAPSAFGVDVDTSGNVYISSGFDNIQVYAPTAGSNPPDTTITSAVDGNGATITNGGTLHFQVLFGLHLQLQQALILLQVLNVAWTIVHFLPVPVHLLLPT